MTPNTKEMFEKAFEIYESGSNNIKLLTEMGMNENSASMTLTWYKHTLNGESHKRHAPLSLIKFILEKLYNNNDKKRLSLALKSLKKYISYYKNEPLTEKKAIINEFEKKLALMGEAKSNIYSDAIGSEGAETIGDVRENWLDAAKSLIASGDKPLTGGRGFAFWCVLLTDEIPKTTPILKLINAMKSIGEPYIYVSQKKYEDKFGPAFKSRPEKGKKTLMERHKEDPQKFKDSTVQKAINKYSFEKNKELMDVRKSLGLPSHYTKTDEPNKTDFINHSKEKDGQTMNHPLNQILYGPPGTGKTYQTIDLAVEILDMEGKDHKENHSTFRRLLGDQIEFITFHPSYAYEDFIQGLRPNVENTVGSLSFTWKDGVFKRIADRAKENYETYAQENEEELKNYVLIIDEINRANISRVFGELVTLIEDDKRLGGSNELEVVLPSEEPFSVPPNLYIVGTMNTADKSIALVDIALRRRFVFKRIYPELDLVTDEYHRQILEKLNFKIIEMKGPDFQIGHSYFMAFTDAGIDLKSVMDNKIIPLLYEYFMNDGESVKQVLSYAELNFIEENGLIVFQP